MSDYGDHVVLSPIFPSQYSCFFLRLISLHVPINRANLAPFDKENE